MPDVVRGLYTAGLCALAPIVGPPWLLFGAARGKYLPVLPERLGLRPPSPAPPAGGIWVHGVSAGETLLSRTLARALARRGLGPVVLSATTASGLAFARAARDAGDAAAAVASPLDFPFALRRAFARLSPRAVVLVEAEVWPNWLAEAARRRVPVLLVNARLSERSVRRWLRFGALFRPCFASLAAAGARSDVDRDRLVRCGVARGRIKVTGDLKFDAEPPRWSRAEARAELRLPPAGLVFAAGSVLGGELEAVLGAFLALRAERPDAVLLLAPRKGFELPRSLHGLTVVRRTARQPVGAGGVLLLDTMGELRDAYAACDLAFVGGSLVPHGGHNVLEPAAAGVAVLFGPAMDNFLVPATRLLAERGALQVGGAGALAEEVLRLARDPVLRAEIGTRARAVVEAGKGAVERTVELVARAIESCQTACLLDPPLTAPGPGKP